MATDFILAPNARWQGRNQTGQPVQNGKLYTYLNQTVVPKATYQDYQGLQPNTNPVILDGKGEANIYWAVDDLYTIKLFTEDDEEVYTQDNYPVVGTNTTRIVSESESNIIRNPQFYYWNYGTTFSPVSGLGSSSITDFIVNDWLYTRVSSTYTVNITQQTFAVDQTSVPGNPVHFLRYEATTAPTGETNNRLYQTYQSVQTLAGQTITIGLRAKSPTASTINVYLVQNFGTGGSPSTAVTTLVGQFALSTSWELKQGTITLPDLVGKTVGSNGDDNLTLQINFSNDVAATVDLANIQFQTGASLSSFPFEAASTQFQQLIDRVNYAVFSTGDVKPTFKTAVDPGWVFCADNTIGNTGSGASTAGIATKALFTLLWTVLTNAISPMLTSAGAGSSRGASAEADWNALKRLTLSRTLGRALCNAGSGAGLTARPLGEWNVGAETVTLDTTMIPAHTHAPGSTATTFSGEFPPGTGTYNYSAGNNNGSFTQTASTGGGLAHNNMQPSVFMNFMIKL